MKKMKMFVVLTVIMVLLFTGCSGGQDGKEASKKDQEKNTTEEKDSGKEQTGTSEPAGEAKKLTVWIAGSGEASIDQAYRKVLDNYCSENTNISYELTFIPWGDYFTKLNTGLIGGAGPDIFMLGYGQMGTVQAGGDLLPLNQYTPADWDGKSDFYENILDICKKDEELYGLFKPSTRTFMYRKDIAAKNGVTEDELTISTQEELFNLIRKMTVYDDKKNVEMFGLEIDPDSEQNFFVYTAQLMEEPLLWKGDWSANFNNDKAIQAMTNTYNLYKEGVVSLMDPAATNNGLNAGIAAMALCADANYATLDAAFPDQIGVIKSDMNTLLIGDYIAINNATKHPEDAAKMFFHMFSTESSQIFAEVAAQYSGRKSLDEEYVALNPEFANIVASYPYSISYGAAMNPKFNAAVTILRTSLEEIYHGADPKATLEKAAEGWNATFNE